MMGKDIDKTINIHTVGNVSQSYSPGFGSSVLWVYIIMQLLCEHANTLIAPNKQYTHKYLYIHHIFHVIIF